MSIVQAVHTVTRMRASKARGGSKPASACSSRTESFLYLILNKSFRSREWWHWASACVRTVPGLFIYLASHRIIMPAPGLILPDFWSALVPSLSSCCSGQHQHLQATSRYGSALNRPMPASPCPPARQRREGGGGETVIIPKSPAQLDVACRRHGPALWLGRAPLPYTARRIHTFGKVPGARTGGSSVDTGMLRPQCRL